MVISKTSSKKLIWLTSLLMLMMIGTSVQAGSSTATKKSGETSAEGGYINIHNGSGKMVVKHDAGVAGLYGYAKKSLVLLPDPTVHRSYAANTNRVSSSFSPEASSYYPEAYGEYSSKETRGTVTISGT